MKSKYHGICVLTTDVPAQNRTHEQIAAAAIQGGAAMIQFRDKTMDDGLFAETASRILQITRAAGVPLIVNDRVAIAIAIGADGVHVGSNDGDPDQIKQNLPTGMILGVSARNYAEAMAMNTVGADYLGVGPVFPTASKEDATPPIGTEELKDICRDTAIPVIGIGGIDYETLPLAMSAGCSGVAVISAVSHAGDMVKAVHELVRCHANSLRQATDCHEHPVLPDAVPAM
jgi:thiamine-phosphate pyrophosphorylase